MFTRLDRETAQNRQRRAPADSPRGDVSESRVIARVIARSRAVLGGLNGHQPVLISSGFSRILTGLSIGVAAELCAAGNRRRSMVV